MKKHAKQHSAVTVFRAVMDCGVQRYKVQHASAKHMVQVQVRLLLGFQCLSFRVSKRKVTLMCIVQ